jgi:hypothetical protein
MKAIQIEAFGNPAAGVKAVDVLDVGAPAAGAVVIALVASPMNPYGLLMIAGGYGYRPRLSAVGGTAGVGRVVAVGAAVKHLKAGDRTLVPFLHPPWAERIKTEYLLLTDIIRWPRGSDACGSATGKFSNMEKRTLLWKSEHHKKKKKCPTPGPPPENCPIWVRSPADTESKSSSSAYEQTNITSGHT